MSKIDSLEIFLEHYIDEPALTVGIERYTLPTEENFWQWRELYRVYKEELKKPAFGLQEELDIIHNVHIDPDDPKLLRYFPNAEKGKRDLPVRIKYGKYLTRFYGEFFDNEQVKQFVSEHMYNVAPAVLKLVEPNDMDMAEKVYEEGPNSCMKRERGHIRSVVHPCRAYPTESLTIAYILKGDRITARTVVNIAAKTYVRIYGDSGMMKPLLQEAGYHSDSDALRGCRIHRIPDDPSNQTDTRGHETLVVPYVDGNYTSGIPDPDDPDNYILITNDGKDHIGLQNACGYTNAIQVTARTCNSCGNVFPRDETVPVHNGVACIGCYADHYHPALNADNTETPVPYGHGTTVHGITYVDDEAARAHGYRLSVMGWVHNSRTPDIPDCSLPAAFVTTYTAIPTLGNPEAPTECPSLEFRPGTMRHSRLCVDPYDPPSTRYSMHSSRTEADRALNNINRVCRALVPHMDPASNPTGDDIARKLTELTNQPYSATADPLVLSLLFMVQSLPLEPTQEPHAAVAA